MKKTDLKEILGYGEYVEERADGVRVFRYVNDSGQGYMYISFLYPGIAVWFNKVSLRCLKGNESEEKTIKINYCLKGRCELELENDTFTYVDPTHLSVGEVNAKNAYIYPTGKYEGLEIMLMKDRMSDETKHLLQSIGFSYDDFAAFRIGTLHESCLDLMDQLTDKIQSAKGSAEEYRIYVLNILYQFAHGAFTPSDSQNYLTKGQRMISQQVESYLTSDLTQHTSIETLAKRYSISASSLKKYFKLAFGKNISEYMQEKRCEEASRLLKETDLKIVEIANTVGYLNQGKFTAVFQKIYGCSPLEYRRRNHGSI